MLRRQFLQRSGAGLGGVALSTLLSDNVASQEKRFSLAAQQKHFATKAKSVIWLFMHGAPSQVDTWDYKPELARRDGQTLAGFDQSTGFFAGAGGPIMRSPFKFARHGESGAWASEIFPNLARHVDEMAFINSCYAFENNHSPAQFQISSGVSRMGFPCLGSWVVYGLGSENQNLPGFIVMYDSLGRGLPKSRASSWGAGFLPAIYHGTAMSSNGAPIRNLRRAARLDRNRQRAQLDLIRDLNGDTAGEAELQSRIESFELAFRMQKSAADACSLQDETRSTQRLYGMEDSRCRHFGRQCLLARRLVERGVRFVQIFSGGFNNEDCWDGHRNINKNHRTFAGETDLPIAGLLADLKQRGLLDSTLIVWCGEFGRLPLIQKGGTGRDHNPNAFTAWMAGGGIKAGAKYGATDELGNKAVENRVNVNDLHATILHLMGLNHERLTYRHNGRDYRLTDVAGRVIREIVA